MPSLIRFGVLTSRGTRGGAEEDEGEVVGLGWVRVEPAATAVGQRGPTVNRPVACSSLLLERHIFFFC